MQALQLMNDVQRMEAARNLAQRILGESGVDANTVRWAWRVVTAPSGQPAQIITNVLAGHRARFAKDAEGAKQLIAFGESKADPNSRLWISPLDAGG